MRHFVFLSHLEHTEYTRVQDAICTVAQIPDPPTACTPATACGQVGPAVCARLNSPDPKWPNGFTTAVFANLCELTMYNCQNPTQREYSVDRVVVGFGLY